MIGLDDRAHEPADTTTATTAGGAILMDGNRLRDEIVARLGAEIDGRRFTTVCLATVLVGDDRPSQIYVRSKHKKADEAGMIVTHVELPRRRRRSQIEDAVGDARRRRGACTASSCQLPLPAGLDPEPVLALSRPRRTSTGSRSDPWAA